MDIIICQMSMSAEEAGNGLVVQYKDDGVYDEYFK